MNKEKGTLIDKGAQESDHAPSYPVAPDSASPEQQQAPVFETVESRPRLLSDLFRVLLVLLSLVVAAGFILIVLPQSTIDKMTQELRSRHAGVQQEKIGFLYLGDEVKDGSFHVRGVVRNISGAPIEKLDAAVRLYSKSGNLNETTLVRMDKETIAPDDIALFDLVYPNYQSQFKSYSVEFKLRDGDLMPYKDMRDNAAGNRPAEGGK